MPIHIRLNSADKFPFRGKRVAYIRATKDGTRYILRTTHAFIGTVAPGDVPEVDREIAKWTLGRVAARQARGDVKGK